jgi:hypothetical protein
MECQLQMREVVQKLVSTSLFSIQDLKLSTMDIIVVLKDTLNTTSSPLPIPDSHVTGVLSNSLERHSIGSHVVDGIRNLVTNFNMAKLVGSLNLHSHIRRELRTSHLWICYSAKALWIAILSTKSHSFPKVVPSEKASIAIKVVIVHNIESAI